MKRDASQPLPALPGRVLAVFVSPGPLFRQLRERPVWAGALCVAALVMMTGTALAFLPVETLQDELRQLIDEINEQTGLSATGALIVGMLFGGAMTFVHAWLAAGVMYFVLAKLLRDNGEYRQYLSMTSHALIVDRVGRVLLFPVQAMIGDLEWTPSLAALAPGLEDGYLLAGLEHLDLFKIWLLLLLGLGASTIHPGRSWISAFVIVLLLSVLPVLGLEALGALLARLA